ncbi:cupin domain-containing protein [Amycolatopsis sp. VS8301801F10]|uniref:cupin domain-containing protein n=1 Tax=Amycolatopsis sp. VS8301801F10 TaxID=2652442 RepID=UPI0038FC87FF
METRHARGELQRRLRARCPEAGRRPPFNGGPAGSETSDPLWPSPLARHTVALPHWQHGSDGLPEATARVERHLYSAGTTVIGEVPSKATPHDLHLVAPSVEWDDTLPAGTEGYFLRSRTGERRGWPDAVNSFLARGRNTGGRYFAVNTLAAPQPYVIRHFHRRRTENFLCLSGRIWLWVNGEEILLTPGDFLHAPAAPCTASPSRRTTPSCSDCSPRTFSSRSSTRPGCRLTTTCTPKGSSIRRWSPTASGRTRTWTSSWSATPPDRVRAAGLQPAGDRWPATRHR